MNLIQIRGEGIEELYSAGNDVTAIEVEKYYNQYLKDYIMDGEIESFEEWMEENFPKVPIERVFVDEVYV